MRSFGVSIKPTGRSRLVALLVSLAVLTVPAIAQAEVVRIGGGAAGMENVFKRIKPHLDSSAGMQMDLKEQGPVDAFKDLDSGKLDAAAAGLELRAWFELMESNGYKVSDQGTYKSRVVGRDKIQVLAHKGLSSVKALNKEQLKGIFTGKITNWKEVGGPDLPLKVVFGSKIPGTNKLWGEKIMDKEPWAKDAIQATETTDVKGRISQTPGAVGIGPLASEDQSIHSPDTPEIGRPITVITKGAPSESMVKVFNYIAGEGQKHIVR